MPHPPLATPRRATKKVAAIEPDQATGDAAGEAATAPAASPETQVTVPDTVEPAALREAAANGDPKALFAVANRYADGIGVDADMAKAAGWYRRSAELGFAPAQYRIGNFYEKGIGVDRDIAKAKDWYQRAAEQGNASAMHNLAVLYATGADSNSGDNQKAAHWFTEAAELGVKDSQYNLGILAAKGIGMPQDLVESYKWFDLVAQTGDKDAAAKRDEVANALRPEQLEKARAAAKLWKPRELDEAANVVDLPDAWKLQGARTASLDMKQAVQNVQLILNKNGYDAGPADGIMGDRTRSAIKSFQKDNGMSPTGELDETLVRSLLERK